MRKTIGMGWLALLLLLAACTSTPALIPTSTPAPTAPPNSLTLPAHFQFETLGTQLTLDYPEGWQADRWAQMAALYATHETLLPQVGLRLFYHYRSPEGGSIADVGGLARWRPLWQPHPEVARRMSSDGLLGEILAQMPEATLFEWGDYPAAYLSYRYQDARLAAPVRKYQLVLQLPEEDSFLVLWAAVPEAELADLAPILRAMLASLTLDGAPLAVEPVLAAAQQRAIPAMPTPLRGDAPRDAWVGPTRQPF